MPSNSSSDPRSFVSRILPVFLMLALSAGPVSGIDLRVLLVRSAPSVEISSASGMTLESPSDHSVLTVVSTVPCRIDVESGRIVVGRFGSFGSPVRVKGSSPLRLNGKLYRGGLTIHLRNGALLAVNDVGLEEYLYGVVPREISENWSAEAVKAQAVVARTFALVQRLEAQDTLYDLDNSTFSQMYEGIDIESSRINGYVDQTASQVLTYRNGLAQVYYHSSCGGQTEAAGDLWGKPVPYLQSVTCRFCENSPYFNWSLRLSRSGLAKILARKGVTLTPETVRVKRQTASRRAETLVLSDGRRSLEMKANDFRALAGTKELKSLLFTVRSGPGGFAFDGHGFGHGVGMCQWGAKGMSDRGMDYQRILQYYFRGTKLMKAPQMAGNR
jgi:stage II sporulation protein D